jgi:hypothetical protein
MIKSTVKQVFEDMVSHVINTYDMEIECCNIYT